MRPGRQGDVGWLCGPGSDCPELVLTVDGLPQADYAIRCVAWHADLVGVYFGQTQHQLGPGRDVVWTGCHASTAYVDAVEVEVVDAAGDVVVTTGRTPW